MRRVVTLVGLIAAGALAWAATAAAQTNSGGNWHFVSSPRLNPPSVSITANSAGTAPGYIFLAPISAGGRMTGQPGPLIVDDHGNPVYFRPLPRGLKAMDFRPQTYNGKPVLTWWQGTFTPNGIGNGQDVMLDDHYNTVATVRAGHGYMADLHEFKLAPHANAAFISAYRIVPIDLSGCCGGDRNGSIWDSVVQEIDLKTGRVLWQWDPLQHVRLRDSYTTPVHGATWDPYHLNSIDIADNGNVLVSLRNTWTVYEVNRRSSRINWQLGGKRSSFKLEPGSHFAWQHHARYQPDGNLTVFDNEAAPSEARLSRGLVLHLDFVHRAAHLLRANTHTGILAGSQGSVEPLPNGNTFVGWGQKPYFSEFSPSGQLLFDGHLHGYDASYRAYRQPWVGRPWHGPALAFSNGTLFCSWNGETGIARWQVLAGPSPNQLSSLGTVESQGFETAIAPSKPGPYFQVRALDSSANVLGSSQVGHR